MVRSCALTHYSLRRIKVCKVINKAILHVDVSTGSKLYMDHNGNFTVGNKVVSAAIAETVMAGKAIVLKNTTGSVVFKDGKWMTSTGVEWTPGEVWEEMSIVLN